MKNLFFLLFLVLSGSATAQTKLYTPDELEEDADFFFEKLYSVHPDPYYFYPIDEFEKLKDSIYSELNKPLSKVDFILTIARVNSYLDSHTSIAMTDAIKELLTESLMNTIKKAMFSLLYPLNEQGNNLSFSGDSIDNISLHNLTIDSLNKLLKEKNIEKDSVLKSIFLLPPVEVRGNDLFFSVDSVNNITEINGVLAQTIVSESKKYLNEKLNPKTNSMESNALVNTMILPKYDINPPFKIKYGKTNKEQVLEGTGIEKWMSELLSLVEYIESPTPYTYEIYPSHSMAVLHMRTFRNTHKEDFQKQIEEFKEEVDKQNIKYIFYDLTMNAGGHHMGDEALDIIKHDSVYLKRTEITRESAADIEREKVNEMILFPNYHDNNIPNDRLLFVIQSPYTASNADYFCRNVSENKLGILVGEPTGELTKTFSSSREHFMPNTNTGFSIASTFVDYSDFFKSLTTQPDIYWNFKNIREFTEQELLNILNYYKKQKKNL